MELNKLISSYQEGEGIIRVIDTKGKVLEETFTGHGESIDFVIGTRSKKKNPPLKLIRG